MGITGSCLFPEDFDKAHPQYQGFPLARSLVGGLSPVSLRLLTILKCWALEALRQPHLVLVPQ